MIALCYRAAKFITYLQEGEEKLAEIYFKVKPGQKSFSITEGEMIEVDLTEEASKGRANTELLNKIGEITGEKPGIVSGHKSSRKKLVFDQEEDEIRRKIREKS